MSIRIWGNRLVIKRRLLVAAIVCGITAGFFIKELHGVVTCDCYRPPFISPNVGLPNVLFIMDNSNSMDEGFDGEAVGSYKEASKTVKAKKALKEIINQYKTKFRIGLMTYKLPSLSDSSKYYLHNSPYFVSYKPASYCPDPPPVCLKYCLYEDQNATFPTAKTDCETACKNNQNADADAPPSACRADFKADFFDEILKDKGRYPLGSAQRKKYCELIYPKTQWRDEDDFPGDSSRCVFYKHAYPFYSSTNQGVSFLYSSSYSTAEGTKGSNNTFDEYKWYRSKSGQSDNDTGYGGYYSTSRLIPSDSDYALGYYDFGKRLTWYDVARTWFANTSPGGGYLHVPVNNLVDQGEATTTTYDALMAKLNPRENDETGYMDNCTLTDKNLCKYVISAGLTPTAGTLQNALDYFDGKLNQKFCYCNTKASSYYKTYNAQACSKDSDCTSVSSVFTKCQQIGTPILGTCQQNFIVYVTDGLPSVDDTGSTIKTSAELMAAVLTKIGNLSANGIKTFVLGVGLSDEAKSNLDKMAVKAATDIDGHAFYADDNETLAESLNLILSNILGAVASGTSISILSEKTQDGANMVQAVFYPSRNFDSDNASKKTDDNGTWIGYLYDYWLYLTSTKTNIREESDGNTSSASHILDLDQDLVITFDYDPEAGVRVFRYRDSDGDGDAEDYVDWVDLNETRPLWEAGKLLFARAAADRTIYTVDSSSQRVEFTTANLGSFASLLGTPGTGSAFPSCLGADNTTILQNLVSYVRGTDISRDLGGGQYDSCRDRTFKVRGQTNTWKLGDIVYSTPKAVRDFMFCYSPTDGNFTDQVCKQNYECPAPYSECKKKESVVFVGANDGMLHAFKTGILATTGLDASEHEVGRMEGIDSGKELWGFIPKNALPYLRWLPSRNYCHLSFVDLTPYYFTTTDGKKILIGGMRLGGAPCTSDNNDTYSCTAPSDTCGEIHCDKDEKGDVIVDDNCTNPPNCTGLSSYFALDVTNPEDPQFLWEFTEPRLGYSYSGPAVIHRHSKYYVMFLSGPTTLNGNAAKNQKLRAFILSLDSDLKIDHVTMKNLGENYAFSGRLFTNGLDVDNDNNTDFVFFGFSYSPNGQIDNWKGGIAKVWTGDDNPLDATAEPESWDFDLNYFNAAQQPFTAKIEFAKCFNQWYIFAGSGRYFYSDDEYSSAQNDRIMAVPFFCDADNNCTRGSINWGHSSSEVCPSAAANLNKIKGWYQELDAADGNYSKERVVTDPTITSQNIIFFTTSQPTAEVCKFGGRTRLWGLNCATGEAITDTTCAGYTVSNQSGALYLQTSTGAITGIQLMSSFVAEDGKATAWVEGMPPEAPTSFLPPNRTRGGRLMHWIEK